VRTGALPPAPGIEPTWRTRRNRGTAGTPAGRRARESAIRGDGHVPGALGEMPKPVVVALLRAGRGRHGNDHRPFAHAGQLLVDDGPRSA
jgi:hypothetical protein